MSLTMTLTRKALGLQPKPLESEAATREVLPKRLPPAPIPGSLRRRCTIERTIVEGFDVVTLRPRSLPAGSSHLLYLHGGAYISPLVSAHWRIIEALLRRTPASVTVPMYGLAPEHTVDEAFEMLDVLTAGITAKTPAGRLVVAGDSAGGGLALAHTQHLRDGNRQVLPAALILFSPWVDVTMANPDIAAIEPRDVMLASAGLRACGTWWSGGRQTTDPRVSPLLGNLIGLPPVSTFQGGYDLFLPDVTRLHERIQQAGGSSSLTIAPGGFHVYVSAPWTPEARAALDKAATVLRGTEHRPAAG
ncbi:alpha/beta hydrolase [Mycobacteroides salmoniphilum]|uniref:Acetyl-hydrolase LipR n=1 Tax=Mycobacteroides salmoniphilum TaxID=404941 RepID=A0A4R8SHG0_9MYCO|nr:alpha/beta hydrolase [Mycobacteroides salmoniphilum]TDZ96396.1 putative acetyl-hydrolase LipR precursor [Mycobacteroides salmoniphilum]TEA05491.1 putative acetyl-hydrolase LipR precursor [Mycobacteroides salmoniphilum]